VFKLLLFITLCVSLIFYHFASLGNPHLEILGDGYMSIYSRQLVDSPYIIRRHDIATGFIYTTRSYNAPALRAKFTQIDGESITLDTYRPKHEILRILRYRVVHEQRNNIMHITYAYSGRGRDFIRDGDTRINLQISSRAGRVTIGWPVILSGF